MPVATTRILPSRSPSTNAEIGSWSQIQSGLPLRMASTSCTSATLNSSSPNSRATLWKSAQNLDFSPVVSTGSTPNTGNTVNWPWPLTTLADRNCIGTKSWPSFSNTVVALPDNHNG